MLELHHIGHFNSLTPKWKLVSGIASGLNLSSIQEQTLDIRHLGYAKTFMMSQAGCKFNWIRQYVL